MNTTSKNCGKSGLRGAFAGSATAIISVTTLLVSTVQARADWITSESSVSPTSGFLHTQNGAYTVDQAKLQVGAYAYFYDDGEELVEGCFVSGDAIQHFTCLMRSDQQVPLLTYSVTTHVSGVISGAPDIAISECLFPACNGNTSFDLAYSSSNTEKHTVDTKGSPLYQATAVSLHGKAGADEAFPGDPAREHEDPVGQDATNARAYASVSFNL
jgi:hypothetical protein